MHVDVPEELTDDKVTIRSRFLQKHTDFSIRNLASSLVFHLFMKT